MSVNLWTLALANDIRMYRPLVTLACMHLRDVRERLPACCTLAQVLHSLVNLAVPLSKNSRKFFSGREFFFLGYPLFGGVRDDFEFEFEFKRVVNPIFKFIFKLQFELQFERSTLI